MTIRDPIKHAAVRRIIDPILRMPTITTTLDQWTMQGLGMLRCRIDANFRLHIWHSELEKPGVKGSKHHTHAWDFHQYTYSGEITNIEYTELWEDGAPFWRQKVECGADGCAMDEPVETRLGEFTRHTHTAGDSYYQSKHDIHATDFIDGSVSIIHRVKAPGPDIAHIFYPVGEDWVNCPALPATWEQVQRHTWLAREQMALEAKNAS